jgi:hypothetical protein
VTTLEISLFSCLLAALQAAGLFSTWLARRGEGSRRQALYHWLFFACLACLGGSTIYTLFLDGTWLASGAVLALMAVAGTCEFRGPRSNSPLSAIPMPRE